MNHLSGAGAGGVRIGAEAMALVQHIGKTEQRTHRIVVERALALYVEKFYPEMAKPAAKGKAK